VVDENDEVIFLFDNCTDGSEWVFDGCKHLLSCETRKIVSLEDKFEVKSNNMILKLATHDIIVLFQDDMILEDDLIKQKILRVIGVYGNKLGLLGCRDGYELTSTKFPEMPVNKISSWKHREDSTPFLEEGDFQERTYLNRGAIVFTRNLLDEVGYLDEAYFPLWGDDMDYCARAKYQFGRTNVVFQCKINSQIKWGATRNKDTPLYKLTGGKYAKKNWNLLISRWGQYFK